MAAAGIVFLTLAAAAGLAVLAAASLFFPPRRTNPRRLGNSFVRRGAGGVSYSLEKTGGIPWLSVNGLPYPGSFDSTDRRRFSLDGRWRLREDSGGRGVKEAWFAVDAGAEWKETTVPATYNPANSDRTDYLGALWYRKTFAAEEIDVLLPGLPEATAGEPAPEKRLRLCFEGVLLRGGVWLNGIELGSFEGGYTPFFFDITEKIRDENVLTVRCDNRLTADSLPPRLMKNHKPGWHTYAGIYRPVFVEEIPESSVVKAQVRTRFDGGGGGLMTVEVLGLTAGNSAVTAEREARRPGVKEGVPALPDIRFSLKAPNGTDVDRDGPNPVGIPGSDGTAGWTASFPLVHIEEWRPGNPSRYTLVIELRRGASVDRVTLKIGPRDFRISGDTLLLSGKPLFLKGICRHEDHPELGATQPAELIDGDLALIRKTGANYVRLAHYPHRREELDAAEEAGLLLSEEIPLYQAGMGFTAWFQENRRLRNLPAALFGLRQMARRGLQANARRQLIEMIERDRHRPAILFWSLGNECYTLGRRAGRIFSWLRESAREFDPDRPVTVVEVTFSKFGLDRFRRGWDGADILSVNSYFGWYYGRTGQLPDYLDEIRRRWPERPLILSEFGAGAAPGRSDADGAWQGERLETNRTYSEDYQVSVLKDYWRAAAERPWVAGYSPWVFADFYNTWFPGNPVPNYNLKGIVSADRTPKKSWYALKDLYREPRS